MISEGGTSVPLPLLNILFPSRHPPTQQLKLLSSCVMFVSGIKSPHGWPCHTQMRLAVALATAQAATALLAWGAGRAASLLSCGGVTPGPLGTCGVAAQCSMSTLTFMGRSTGGTNRFEGSEASFVAPEHCPI